MPEPPRTTYRRYEESIRENDILLGKKHISQNRIKLLSMLDKNTKYHNTAPDEKQQKTISSSNIINSRSRSLNVSADITPNRKPVPEIDVKLDGSWTRQGFQSSFGITGVMSCLTGQVIDFYFLSKYCNRCLTIKDHKELKLHQESGNCKVCKSNSKNYLR